MAKFFWILLVVGSMLYTYYYYIRWHVKKDFFSEDTDQYEFFLHITLKWALWEIKKIWEKHLMVTPNYLEFQMTRLLLKFAIK